MYLHLLGAIELTACGRALPISSWKVRTLLAALAVDLERPVSPAVLAERLWDGEPPPSAAGTLQVYVSRLRAALRDAAVLDTESGERPVEIVSRPGTYALRAEPEQIDWHAYHRLARQARALVEEGEDREALDLLDQADDIWQGEPLAGLPGEWAQQTRKSMQDRWLAAQLTRSEIELRLGRYADLVPTLAELAAKYPWNERVAAHLMTALYGSGRIAEALATYRRIRNQLGRDLGTRPGERLNTLNHHMINGAGVAALVPHPAVAPAAPARTTPPRPAPRQGPAQRIAGLLDVPDLVGRENELALLTAAARGEWPARTNGRGAEPGRPVVAISGLPGSGKTALATAAADRLQGHFPDGVHILRLGTYSGAQHDPSPEAAATALLRLFGVPARRVPVEREELLGQCHELLTERQALVILDDAAGPGQIGPLLPSRPNAFVLVTSRHRMAALPAVVAVPLDALSPAASAEMFVRLTDPDRTADADRLAEVAHLCAHHPLALQLAAGRFRFRSSWTLAHLADRLARNGLLDEFGDGPDSLCGALAMSYHDLSAEHQVAFRRLSLHPGPDFGLLTAAALIGCPVDRAERLIEDLLSASLLSEHSAERFSYHALVRSYASARARQEDSDQDRRESLRRCVNYLCSTADWADRKISPSRHRIELTALRDTNAADSSTIGVQPTDTVEPNRWVAVEIATLLDLQKHLRVTEDRESAAVLAHVAREHVESRGLWREAIEMHRAAAEHWCEAGADLPELHAQLALAAAELQVAHYPAAEQAAERALALARTVGDLRGAAEALTRQGQLHSNQDDLRGALRWQREALDILREIGDAGAVARAVGNLGIVQSRLGDTSGAIDSLSEALSFARSAGESALALRIINNTGGLYLEIGDNVAARQAFEHVVRSGEGLIRELDLATAQTNLAQLMRLPQEADKALSLIDSAIHTFRQAGALQHQAGAMNVLGQITLASGNLESAFDLYSEAHRIAHSVGAPREKVDALSGLDQVERLLPSLRQQTRTAGSRRFERTGDGDRPDDGTTAVETLAHYRELLDTKAQPKPGSP
ncbi:AfsR/SARP family transcriptional regulator [Kitasatospora griseola]|uniref:AfsR/SARP family transcriptional regulator n=1 Tax=Kitasatospora griseola TaxID=2064 RepID=UPI0016710560|nr:BTAD domain-containing putative transcriptional regulator [Kitasatospora griseola]GGQ59787.1 SARP family transcriptional regulator [Kitasatospora griseola]